MRNMKKIVPILVLILMLGVVGISGCTSPGNQTITNSSYNYTNTTTNDTSSPHVSDSNNSKDSNTSSDGPTPASAAYIANANTGVFHYSWCYYVNKMNEEHKVPYSSREAAINAGYRPCKVCNP